MYEFPKEYLVPIDDAPFHWGKISINKISSGFFSEIQIVFKDGQKIFAHIDTKYNFVSEEDCLNTSMQALSEYLNKKSV